MNDLEKAARLALDALENLGWHGSERECDEAITALRAALKQAEPVVDYTLLHDVAEKDGVRAALELKDKLKQQAEPVSALSRYSETAAEGPVIDMVDALERLRFFCSLAMTEGDWLDVEPFFDDAEQELAKLEQQAEPKVTWGVDWGKDGDENCVAIIKRLPNGDIEVVAIERSPAKPQADPTEGNPSF